MTDTELQYYSALRDGGLLPGPRPSSSSSFLVVAGRPAVVPATGGAPEAPDPPGAAVADPEPLVRVVADAINESATTILTQWNAKKKYWLRRLQRV